MYLIRNTPYSCLGTLKHSIVGLKQLRKQIKKSSSECTCCWSVYFHNFELTHEIVMGNYSGGVLKLNIKGEE